jgi:hypothetical protein
MTDYSRARPRWMPAFDGLGKSIDTGDAAQVHTVLKARFNSLYDK